MTYVRRHRSSIMKCRPSTMSIMNCSNLSEMAGLGTPRSFVDSSLTWALAWLESDGCCHPSRWLLHNRHELLLLFRHCIPFLPFFVCQTERLCQQECHVISLSSLKMEQQRRRLPLDHSSGTDLNSFNNFADGTLYQRHSSNPLSCDCGLVLLGTSIPIRRNLS